MARGWRVAAWLWLAAAKAAAGPGPSTRAAVESFLRAQPRLPPSLAPRVAAAVLSAAQAEKLDPALILAVMDIESRFDPRAVSRAGALGLMQLMPSTARWLAARREVPLHSDEALFEVEINVALGAQYLRLMLDDLKDLEAALVAYNRGPARARRELAGPSAAQVRAGYPQRVFQSYAELSSRIR